MKRPLSLLIGIVVSIIILSIIFPSDPKKPDLLSRIKTPEGQVPVQVKTVKGYRIGDVARIDPKGTALVWSHNEKYLYYSRPAGEDGLEELWVSDLKGDNRKIDINAELYNIKNAKLSPDGSFLSFISTRNDKNSLLVYDTEIGTVNDITPRRVYDVGVTSYDWDDESLNLIMSVDIVEPRIEIYSIRSHKIKKLDMDLKSCRNVAFYRDGRIIFSDNVDGSYGIYSADISGKDISFITNGWNFVLSLDRYKLAILSDENGQEGLWVYYIGINTREILSLSPVHNIYWLSDSVNLLYSTDEDSRNKYTYMGSIYYMKKNMETVAVSGAVHALFVPSLGGDRIAMTSPQSMKDKDDNKGIFVGQLYR